MGHTNPRMFFEVHSKWIDREASGREKAKMDALFVQPGTRGRKTKGALLISSRYCHATRLSH